MKYIFFQTIIIIIGISGILTNTDGRGENFTHNLAQTGLTHPYLIITAVATFKPTTVHSFYQTVGSVRYTRTQ